ncbi:MAG: hypothetical protein F4184_14505 [Gemmatimonadetes bacterium]|nr:hypothetical protein [Gemmatimonadota bacterium]
MVEGVGNVESALRTKDQASGWRRVGSGWHLQLSVARTAAIASKPGHAGTYNGSDNPVGVYFAHSLIALVEDVQPTVGA